MVLGVLKNMLLLKINWAESEHMSISVFGLATCEPHFHTSYRHGFILCKHDYKNISKLDSSINNFI